MTKYIPFLSALLFLTTVLTSCDPAIAVVLENHSGSAKHIKVFYPRVEKTRYQKKNPLELDSIRVCDLSVTDCYSTPMMPILDLDTVARTYSFNLKSNFKAITQSQMGVTPTWGVTFIIDDTDTLRLDPKSADFKRKPSPFFGGEWVHTIVDKTADKSKADE